MATTTQSFMDNLGYETEEEIRARKRREAHERMVQTQMQSTPQNYRTAAGANLVNNFYAGLQKNKPEIFDKMNDSEKQSVKTLDDAGETMRQVESDYNEWGIPLSAEKRSLVYKEALLKAAQKNGDEKRALKISEMIAREKSGVDNQELERDKLRGETDLNKAKEGYYERGKAGGSKGEYKGTMKQVYPRGSKDPYSGKVAFINEKGQAVNPQTGEVFYESGEFGYKAPAGLAGYEKNVARYGKDISVWPEPVRAKELAENWYPKQEQREIRQSGVAADKLMRVGLDVAGLIEESASLYADGKANIFSWTGDMQTKVNGIISGVNGLVKTARTAMGESYSPMEIVNGSPDTGADIMHTFNGTQSGALAFVEGMSDSDYDSIFQQDAAISKEYAAHIVMMTYAIMRAREPGAKQFSDNDFKTQLRTTGGTANNAQEFQRMFNANVTDAIRGFDAAFDPVPAWGKNIVINQKSLDNSKVLRDEYERVFGKLYPKVELKTDSEGNKQTPIDDIGKEPKPKGYIEGAAVDDLLGITSQ
jgi:hypothetical protein